MTSSDLDELTRGFADRYVGLLYSVCDALKEGNPDPEQRRAAQVLIVDNASNTYDIASNSDPFTRVLDLTVITSLVSLEWGDDGRAEAVFGPKGEALVDALSKAKEEARLLAARVLTEEQLGILDSLLRDWRSANPKVTRASFVRFSNFASGRGRSAADQVLAAGGLFEEIGEAGQAVDEARALAERMFYRLKREGTLLRWQAMAVKDDYVATPEINEALSAIDHVADQMKSLSADVAAERQAILDGIQQRLQRADATVAEVKSTVEAADALVQSLKPATDSINEMLTTVDAISARYADSVRSKAGDEGTAFDIEEYGQTAHEVSGAAVELDQLLERAENLLGSPEWRGGVDDVTESLDGRILKVSDEGQALIDVLFWRAAALLGLLFLLMVLYRPISSMLLWRRIGRKGLRGE